LDLREKKNAAKAVKDIDLVFNLAADMGGIGYIMTYNASIMRNNVLINANILEAAKNENVEKLFYSSSACAYPREIQSTVNVVTPPKEDMIIPANPDSSYGWEKLYTEIMCQGYERALTLNPE